MVSGGSHEFSKGDKVTSTIQLYGSHFPTTDTTFIIPFFDQYVTLVGTVPISWSTTVDTLAEDTCIFGPSNPHKILSLEGLEIPILSHLYSQLFNIYSRRVLQNFKNKILKTKYE